MTPPLYIALRFLTHRKRALVLSVSGVVFGVAFFICTQAQTQGFARYFIESNLGTNGALVVRARFESRQANSLAPAKSAKAGIGHRKYFEGITNANQIMRVSRQFSNVVACSPILQGRLSARVGFENATVDLYGIEPVLHFQTTDLSPPADQRQSGRLSKQAQFGHCWVKPGRSTARGCGRERAVTFTRQPISPLCGGGNRP